MDVALRDAEFLEFYKSLIGVKWEILRGNVEPYCCHSVGMVKANLKRASDLMLIRNL